MREIKFRQPLLDVNGEFEMFHYWGIFPDGFVGRELSGCRKGDDQEFTGLKDKNGKEAYQKDIVRRLDILYIIEWHDNLAGWYLKPIHGGWHGITKADMALMCEVIGNIYENKELLK
ncbi:hypothetical protein LCGC14_0405750 [marine sediment metagenome]|uniref:YopX protein domain-containing protein n=1 Tax=marine sediment metagenome TaxID=412755 RepID=A0A0F9VH94_9ZZZZ